MKLIALIRTVFSEYETRGNHLVHLQFKLGFNYSKAYVVPFTRAYPFEACARDHFYLGKATK